MSIPSGISKQGISRWNFIQSAITRGMNATQTYDSLREAGIGYRKTTMLEDFRIATEVERKGSTMKYIGLGKTITDKHYSVAQNPLTGGMRQTTFQITAFDTQKDEWVERHVTVAHDSLLLREDIENLAEAVATGTSPTLEDVEIMPVKALKYPETWIA